MSKKKSEPTEVAIRAKLDDTGLDVAAKSRAVDALDRLAAGLFDLPAAKLKGYIDAINDDNRTKKELRKLRQQAAVEVEKRALQAQFNELELRQQNRDAIAIKAVEELKALPAPDSPGNIDAPADKLSDDWLNFFVSHAENATSDRMRQLLSQVLAGEIRRPSSFSLTTLRIMSEMDQEIATTFEAVVQDRIDTFIPHESGLAAQGAHLSKLMFLEDVGLLSGAADQLSWTRMAGDDGIAFFIGDNGMGLRIKHEPNQAINVLGVFLTRPGSQVASLVAPPSPDVPFRRLAKIIGPEVKEIQLGEIKNARNGKEVWQVIEVLKAPDVPL